MNKFFCSIFFAAIIVISLSSSLVLAIDPPGTIVKVFGNKAIINVVYQENVVLSNVSIFDSSGAPLALQTPFTPPTSFRCGDGKKDYSFTQTFSREGNYTFFIRVADCVNNFREDTKKFVIVLGIPSGCGNGIFNASAGEECDDGNNVDGDGCSKMCLKEICGNNRTDVGELCDGAAVNGQTCKSLGYTNGTLSCDSKSSCKKYDVSKCYGARCGNSVIDPGEECDGFNWGPITDCVSFDPLFTGGSLTCTSATCRFNTSRCKGLEGGTCGDGQLAVGEECDSKARKKCSDFDLFFGDNIKCTNNCTYDTSFCQKPNPLCGDGEINQAVGEMCDGSIFPPAIQGCADLTSFSSGILKCSLSCDIDTSLCGTAGTLNASCLDGKRDGTELDVDCGGICSCCDVQKKCVANTDCCAGYCKGGFCAAPSCTDGVKNGIEPDVDCGGECEKKCAENSACNLGTDCVSLFCSNGVCVQPSCFDGVKNGIEAGVDCAGNCENKCPFGETCEYATDCESNYCEYGVCSVDKTLDTDGDGMPDWWEDKYGLDKNDPSDARKDADKDGYSNLIEYQNGTDPLVADAGGKSHLWNVLVLIFGILFIWLGYVFLRYYRNTYLPEKKSMSKISSVSNQGAYSPGAPVQKQYSSPQSSSAAPKPGSKADLLRRMMEKRKEASPGQKIPARSPSTSAASPPPSSSKSTVAVGQTKVPEKKQEAGDIFAKLKSIAGQKPGEGKSASQVLKEMASKVEKKDLKKGKK